MADFLFLSTSYKFTNFSTFLVQQGTRFPLISLKKKTKNCLSRANDKVLIVKEKKSPTRDMVLSNVNRLGG